MREDGGLFGEHGDIVAACLFSIPPTRWSEPILELSRLVRRDDTIISLTGLISRAVKFMAARGVDLIVSFADRTQGHHGGIYQAASWNYAGCRERRMDGVNINGVFWPGRSLNNRYGTQSPEKLRARLPDRDIEPHYDEGKHLYWKALNKIGKRKADRLGLDALPYVKPSVVLQGRPE